MANYISDLFYVPKKNDYSIHLDKCLITAIVPRSGSTFEKYNSIQFDNDKILGWIKYLIDIELKFEEFFKCNDIKPNKYVYEDLLFNSNKILEEISEYQGIKIIKLEDSSIKKNSNDSQKDEWINKFRKENKEIVNNLLEMRPSL